MNELMKNRKREKDKHIYIFPLLKIVQLLYIPVLLVTPSVFRITNWLNETQLLNIYDTFVKAEEVFKYNAFAPSFVGLPLLNKEQPVNIPCVVVTPVILEIVTFWLKLPHLLNI